MLRTFLQSGSVTVLLFFITTRLWCQDINQPVKIISPPNAPVMEIRNGLMGLVIPKQMTPGPKSPGKVLAPIQSVIYSNGAYSDDSPNYLVSEIFPTSMKVNITRNTPDMVIVVIRYTFNKPASFT